MAAISSTTLVGSAGMGSTTRRAAPVAVDEFTARDQLNLLATFDNPALRALRAEHARRPLRAVDAFAQAVALLDEPHKPTSGGGRAYWRTIEGDEMRSRDLGSPGTNDLSKPKHKRRVRHLPRAG